MGKTSLVWKLILAFLLVAVTAAAIVALSIRLTSVDRLMELIENQQRSSLQAALEVYYEENGSWKGVEDHWRQILFSRDDGEVVETPVTTIRESQPFPGGPGGGDRRSLFGLADAEGRVIISIQPDVLPGAFAAEEDLKTGLQVVVDGEVVGTILSARLPPRFNPEENLFLQRTNTALLIAAFSAMAVALLIGVILARTLIRPLQALTQAAQNITRGQLEQQVNVRAGDEIGQLAQAFNQMSQQVARVNQQRKQMTADIAHDLRTPLTVIAGYVESMRDGVLQPTPERLAVIYSEIERLQHLVDDLRMLSQADAGELPLHPVHISPRSLLEQAAAPFQHRAEQQQVTLTLAADPALPELVVDVGRMMQVFDNLLINSLRYTPAGGKIELSAVESDGAVALTIADTGTGIAEEDLPLIFERFHRADRSRHSESGESGLGLAIVKALVEAQGGRVRAHSALGAGTRITLTLPVGKG